MAKEESCKSIEELKKEYENLAKKHDLPDFREMAEDFEIEKVLEKEAVFLIRDIRRTMAERVSGYLHLFENLINPSSPHVLIFSILKNMKEEERKKMRKIYQQLAKIQLDALKLDTIYDENNEADYILKTFGEWQQLKKEIHSLLGNLSEELKENFGSKENSYFG